MRRQGGDGRGTGAFVAGARVVSRGQVEPGDLLVMVSQTSGAVNLIKVLALREPAPVFDWAYADGDRGGRAFGGGAFNPERPQGAMWEWEYAGGQGSPAWLELYRAVMPADVGRIATYRDLLDHFGAHTLAGLHAAVSERLGRRTKIYLHEQGLRKYYIAGDAPGGEQVLPEGEPPLRFRMESFTVSAFDDNGEQDNMFRIPLRSSALSTGLLELMDPDKASAEGEEFFFEMYQGRGAREEVTV